MKLGTILAVALGAISDASAYTCNQLHKWHGNPEAPYKFVGDYQLVSGDVRLTTQYFPLEDAVDGEWC